MKRFLIISILVALLSPADVYSQILEGTKKTIMEEADKEMTKLVDRILHGKKESKEDTVAKSVLPAKDAESWDCSQCGQKGNTGNFCSECASKKPEKIAPWDCTKCQTKGNTGKFCSNCGNPRPEPIEPWTCPSCQTKENTGKFCSNCGKAKPEEWICPSCKKKNTGNFCDDCGESKPTAQKNNVDKKYEQYADTLGPKDTNKWMLDLNLYDDSTPSSTFVFLTYQDAVDAILDLPTAKWMITPDSIAIWRLKQQNVEAATAIMTTRYSNMILSLGRQRDSLEKAIAGQPVEMPRLAIDSTDRTQALLEAGFSADEKSEAKIEATLIPYLAKKWDMKQSDVKKVITIAKADENTAVDYIKDHYPDKLYTATTSKRPEDDKEVIYVAIADTIRRINEEMESPYAVTLQEELKVLAEKIGSSWKGSEEYNNVIEIEKTIDDMMAKLQKFDNGGETPAFWEKGRVAENTEIDSWNMVQAVSWRKIVEKHLERWKAYDRKLAELESRIETVKGMDNPTLEYYDAKISCCSMVAQVVRAVTIPAAILSVPLAKHVDEIQKNK